MDTPIPDVPDTFVRLFDRQCLSARVTLAMEPVIDAAVSRWIETGRDTLLDLDLAGAGTLKQLASEITSWTVCTPAQRLASYALDKAMEEEAALHGFTDPA